MKSKKEIFNTKEFNTKEILKTTSVKYVILGTFSSLLIFFVIGIPTDVIPNSFYVRMIPSGIFELALLIIISVMFGIYATTFYYLKQKKRKTNNTLLYTGTTTGFIAISCPICLKLLVLIFGTTFLMQFLAPVRPILGVISVLLIIFAVYVNIKKIKSCNQCM